MTNPTATVPNVTIEGPQGAAEAEILTPKAIEFLAALSTNFEAERQRLLAARVTRGEALRKGQIYDFLPETASVRQSEWRVAPIPADLEDRRAEITGPVDRKMVINALNSGANVYMADFEDSTAPTWRNLIEGSIGSMRRRRRFLCARAAGTCRKNIFLFRANQFPGRCLILACTSFTTLRP
jgi:malate synthase